jgi:YesN/AraC family two-component response regulator
MKHHQICHKNQTFRSIEQSKQIRVLIIDDEPLAVEDLKSMIQWSDYGFQIVAVAGTGIEGLERYKQYRPDVMFIDMKLPTLSGLEVCSEIRMLDQHCQIVILTAYREFDFAREALKYNIAKYLLKHELNKQVLISLITEIRQNLQELALTDRTNLFQSQTIVPPEFDHHLELVNRMKNYINTAYALNIGVPEIARYVGGNISTVSRIFHDVTGTSPYQYLMEVRITNACKLIHNSLKTISEIGELVGFRSSQHFSRVFSSRVGCTPSQYRQNKPNGSSN